MDCVLFHHVYSDLHAPCLEKRLGLINAILSLNKEMFKLPLNSVQDDKTANEARHRRQVSLQTRTHFEGYLKRLMHPFPYTIRHACACGPDEVHSRDVRVVL